jgi:hypothetical protein
MRSIESFVCLLVFGYLCSSIFEFVDMRISFIARRAMIPPRRGIDHSFIVVHMTVMFSLKYSAYTSHKQIVTSETGHTKKRYREEKVLIDWNNSMTKDNPNHK